MILTVLASCVVIALIVFKILTYSPDEKGSLKKFPGPRGIPYFGNMVGMPVYGAVFQFKLWTDMYGPISEIKLLGQRFILVSSEKITKDLFVGKGQIISGRPCTFAVKDAQSKFGTSEYLPLMSFNEDHHRHKRIGRSVMTRSHARDNLSIPVLEAQRLMILLGVACEEASTSWLRLTEDLTSRVMASVCFGSPKYGRRLHEYTWELLVWVSPNGVLPNLAIFLDKLPFYCSPWKVMEWFRHRKQQSWFVEILENTREQMAHDTAAPSFFVDHLEASDKTVGKPNSTAQTYPTDDDAARAIGMIATAGVFTVSGPMQNFIRALVCFPEWQPKLQEEMDKVIEFPNLPTTADVAKLPLLRAFLRETTRWRQAIPSGIPHEAEEDYMYDGVLITKGTGIFASEYGMNRDPAVYENPYQFDPTRWFNTDALECGNDLERYQFLTGTPMFGWGRRYCMGHELAQDDIYAFAVNVVWTFNVSTPDHDKLSQNLLPGEQKGGHQWPQAREESLIIMRPEKIRAKFTARHPERMKVLKESYAQRREAHVLSQFDSEDEDPITALRLLGIAVSGVAKRVFGTSDPEKVVVE